MSSAKGVLLLLLLAASFGDTPRVPHSFPAERWFPHVARHPSVGVVSSNFGRQIVNNEILLSRA